MKYTRLLESVKIILFEWDPIGVNNNPLCCGEYDSYAPTICRMLREGADAQKLLHHLGQLQQVSMGLSEVNEGRNRKVVNSLIDLRRQSK